MNSMDSCPCGSGRSYAECCAPYITGARLPPTAEALMRSRYSAYVKHAINYILETYIKDNETSIDPKQTKEWSEESNWLGLKILSVEKGAVSDTEGGVEFEAIYEQAGHKEVHHENARFKNQDGKWLYDQGKIVPAETVVRSSPKIGRNAPCPCGSGKKYKHCHGRVS